VADTPDDPNVEAPNQGNSSDSESRLQSLLSERGPLIIAIGATAASLVLICLFAILLIRNQDSEVATPTPLPESDVEVDTDTFPYEAISESGSITVTLETPIFLDVAGTQFSVQAEVLPAEGVWTPPTIDEATAAWVYGTVINYVFGLDDTDENQSLLEQLVVGDEITLTTRSGKSSTFIVSSRNEVPSDNREIFAQRTPGVTLVLVEENPEDSRLVVQGRFVLSDTQDEVQAGRVVEMGETAQLESLQITVTSVSTQFDRPEVPGGFAVFHIDYQVQNVGTTSVETNSLTTVLADDVGNLYALNPVASQIGNNPPLSGSIAPGQSVVATAGFQIPAGLSSPVLHWQVSLVGTTSSIQINIPFQDATTANQEANIQLSEVSISPDGSSVLIIGQINNLGNQPVIVDVSDVSLTSSSGTIHQILSTNPAFPWSVPPGQTLLYAVTFQRPLTSDAVFTILSQSFQITGLR
jgi:hypothetical protein